MKKNPKNSYLFPLLICLMFLPMIVIYAVYEMGYIGTEKAVSLLEGTNQIHYLIGIVIVGIVLVGTIIKAVQLMRNKDGKTFSYKLVLIFLALVGVLLRFVNVLNR